MADFLIGLLTAVVIAYAAHRAHALNRGGAIGAAVLGTVVFGLGGVGWAAVMLTFFITSTALSKVFKTKKARTGDNFAKGANRDAWQVAANGGLAGVAALSFFILKQFAPSYILMPLLWVAFSAGLAGANADTWGTELGVLNPRQPVLLTNLRRVPMGTSGAISLVGTLAALAGSALVASVAVWAGRLGWAPQGGLGAWRIFTAITGAGLVGALVDSLLGATLQAMYHCPACDKHTEKHPTHTCGEPTLHVRGLPWLNNDGVNLMCTLSAALAGVVFVLLL
ncbi:MAG: DUF92 domain-containing protein [Brevefilum sp.]